MSISSKFATFARIGVVCCGLIIGLAGCSSTKFGFPYKVGVQQGNWITKEQVAMIQPGMSREQVKFALGSPALTDVFHANRWDYPYFYRAGSGKIEERQLTIFFVDGKVEKWQGDEQPTLQPYQIAKEELNQPQKDAAQVAAEQVRRDSDKPEAVDKLIPGVQADGGLVDRMADPASSTDVGVTGTQPMR